jgi:nucleoside 2-deoxyribosyltransferase
MKCFICGRDGVIAKEGHAVCPTCNGEYDYPYQKIWRKTMNIYIAGRYGRRVELTAYASELERTSSKHHITSRWLLGTHEAHDTRYTQEQARGWALDDLEDLLASDTLIAFTEESGSPYGRGGRHVEFGYALALGKRIIVIGPAENIFCCLPNMYRYETFEEFLNGMLNG